MVAALDAVGQPVQHPRAGPAGARRHRAGAARGGRRWWGRRRRRSSSPRAGPRATTWPSAGWRWPPARRAGPAGSAAAHVVSSAIEHPAVHGALDELAARGLRGHRLPVGPGGELTPEALQAALRDGDGAGHPGHRQPRAGQPSTRWASWPRWRATGGPCFTPTPSRRRAGSPSTSARGDVDAVTLSAHKMHGPKGVGRGLRAARAATCIRWWRAATRSASVGPAPRTWSASSGSARPAGWRAPSARRPRRASAGLRDRLEAAPAAIPGARRPRRPARRVPGTLNVGFEGAEGGWCWSGWTSEGICVSTGAACTSGSLAPSPVLLALGLPPDRAREAVRFSLGPRHHGGGGGPRGGGRRPGGGARARGGASGAVVKPLSSPASMPDLASWWPCRAASTPRPPRRCCMRAGPRWWA